jgi:hypothetical protein
MKHESSDDSESSTIEFQRPSNDSSTSDESSNEAPKEDANDQRPLSPSSKRKDYEVDVKIEMEDLSKKKNDSPNEMVCIEI